MTELELAVWLYDEFDSRYDLEPDACDAFLGPHVGWENLAPCESAYWLEKARELLGKLRSSS